MPSLVKAGKVVEDSWRLVSKTAPDYAEHTIVPLGDRTNPGVEAVWISADTELEDFIDDLLHLDVIAIEFSAFADGRGLSLATLLRTRYGFRGELRAIGEVEPDLTPFMLRSGFDAFEFPDQPTAETAIQCMSSMSASYQGSVTHPNPVFRRTEHI